MIRCIKYNDYISVFKPSLQHQHLQWKAAPMRTGQAMIPPRVTGPIFGPFIPNDSAVGSDMLVEQPPITSVPLPPHLPKSGRNKMFLIDFYFRPKLSRSFQYFLFLSNQYRFIEEIVICVFLLRKDTGGVKQDEF